MIIGILLLCILSWTFTACAGEKDAGDTGKDGGEALDTVILRPAVYEYGEPSEIIDNGKYLRSYILFPQTGNAAFDPAIKSWADSFYEEALDEITAMRETDKKARGEINVQYDAFLVNEIFAGIKEMGMYSHSQMAHPKDFIKTFNLNIETGAFLKNEEILDPAQTEKALAILRKQIQSEFPDLSAIIETVDGSWLEHLVLSHEGVEVLLARGDFLPSYAGTKAYTLSYDALGDAFLPFSSANPLIGPPLEETNLPQAPGNAIDPNRPMVALTFDDGPSDVTPYILDLLKQNGGRATFCVLGNRTAQYADTVWRAISEGSEVIGHSWDHRQLTKLSAEEIRNQLESTNEEISKITGIKPRLYRPPYGASNDQVKAISAELGLSLVNWSVDTIDWKTRNADAVYQSVMSNVQNGSIILCHDIYGTTGDAMARVIPELTAQGYQLVTVSELLGLYETPAVPGEVYFQR